jgi:hypothetical protein
MMKVESLGAGRVVVTLGRDTPIICMCGDADPFCDHPDGIGFKETADAYLPRVVLTFADAASIKPVIDALTGLYYNMSQR